MSCQKAECDCVEFKKSFISHPKFVGVCTNCEHGHNDEDDVLHQLAVNSNSKPCQILDTHLFIGNIISATNKQVLNEMNITHIVNCCPKAFGFATNKTPLGEKEGFERIDLDDFEDSAEQSLTLHLEKSFDFIVDANNDSPPRNVLVHCAQGVSRSASVIIYFLMRHRAMSFEQALRHVQQTRPIAKPNASFETQLRTIERELNKHTKIK